MYRSVYDFGCDWYQENELLEIAAACAAYGDLTYDNTIDDIPEDAFEAIIQQF